MQLLFNGENSLNKNLIGSYKQKITSSEGVVEFNIAPSFSLLGLTIDNQEPIEVAAYLDSSLTYKILGGTWKGEVILSKPIDIVNLDNPISSKFYFSKPAGVAHTITIFYSQPEYNSWTQVNTPYTTNGGDLLILFPNSDLTFNSPLFGNVHLYPVYSSESYSKFVRVVIEDGSSKKLSLNSPLISEVLSIIPKPYTATPLTFNLKLLNNLNSLGKLVASNNKVTTAKSYWEVIKEAPNNSLADWAYSLEYEVSSSVPDDYLIHISLTDLNIWANLSENAKDIVPYYKNQVPDFYVTADSASLTGDLYIKVELEVAINTLKIYYGNSNYSNGGGDSIVLRQLLDVIEA